VNVDPPRSEPRALLQRTALNLDGGKVIFGLGGNDGDCGSYRGTVVSVPEAGGSPSFWQYQPAAPSSSGGAVWGPSGPAVDNAGNIYASTGNPNPPQGTTAETYDYSDSVIELNQSLGLIGHFAPPSWLSDSNDDLDLGSAGPEPLPGGLLFQAGKNGTGYLIDEQTLGTGAGAVYSHQVCAGHGSFGGDAYAAGVIYIPCTSGAQALSYDQGARTFTPLWQGPSNAFGPPILSGGLAWVLATGGFQGGGTTLYGLDTATGAARYTETLPSPVADHFASPSAGGGRLFVATGSSVTAYQIAQIAQVPAVAGVSPRQGPVGGATTVTITGSGFTGAGAVTFGSTAAASFTVDSPTKITALSPGHTAGVVDVTVSASGGTSAVSSKDHFKFTPTVTKVNPSSGPVAGGASVTVKGTGFVPGTTATSFKFGTTLAATVSCGSSTRCTVLAPAHAAGTVDVKAIVDKASSPKNRPADQFTYG
jgi:IPT/TIG domain